MGGLVDIPLSRLTVARTGTATRVNASGLIETVAANTPRIDYDPATLACRGLLIEEARTNLLLRSAEFDVSPWSTFNISVTPNAALAPDGTLSADTITSTGAGAVIAQLVSSTAVAHTASVWLRTQSGTLSVMLLIARNIPNATVVSKTVTVTSAWQRFDVTGTLLDTSPHFFQIGGGGTLPSGSVVYVWSAQMEAGASATSYIPTTTAAASRGADAPTMPVSGIPAWTDAAGTLFVEASWDAISHIPGVICLDDGTAQNAIVMYGIPGPPDTPRFAVYASGAPQAVELGATYSGVSVGQTFRAAGAWAANDFAFSRDGLPTVTDTAGLLPRVTTLRLGYRWTAYLNGHIRRVQYIPRRLSNAELQALTA